MAKISLLLYAFKIIIICELFNLIEVLNFGKNRKLKKQTQRERFFVLLIVPEEINSCSFLGFTFFASLQKTLFYTFTQLSLGNYKHTQGTKAVLNLAVLFSSLL